jgi:hypothetical protein
MIRQLTMPNRHLTLMQASGDEQRYCAGPLRPMDGEALLRLRYDVPESRICPRVKKEP